MDLRDSSVIVIDVSFGVDIRSILPYNHNNTTPVSSSTFRDVSGRSGRRDVCDKPRLNNIQCPHWGRRIRQSAFWYDNQNPYMVRSQRDQ